MKPLTIYLLFVILSCNSTDSNRNPFNDQVFAPLIPLKIGNSWTYQINSKTLSDTTTFLTDSIIADLSDSSDLFSEGLYVFSLDSVSSDPIKSVFKAYQYADNFFDIIYGSNYPGTLNNITNEHFKHPANLNDQWIHKNWNYEFNGDTIIFVNQIEYECIKYTIRSFNEANVLKLKREFYFDPSIGIIKIFQENFFEIIENWTHEYLLIDYNVN